MSTPVLPIGFAGKMSNEIHTMLLFLGYEYISSGCFRDVYRNKDVVYKIAKLDIAGSRADGIAHNLAEVDNWDSACDDAKEYMAKIYGVSNDGIVLCMAYAEPLKELPKLVPNWATDVKKENLGMINNKLVVTDYAYIKGRIDSIQKHKLIKPRAFSTK